MTDDRCLFDDGSHARPLPDHDLCSTCERRRAADRNDDRPAHRPGGFVIKAPGVGYFVKSRSEPGWWLVSGKDCSGPHCEGRVCWHVRRTFEFEKALATPRPTAPPNISALVD